METIIYKTGPTAYCRACYVAYVYRIFQKTSEKQTGFSCHGLEDSHRLLFDGGHERVRKTAHAETEILFVEPLFS